MTIRSNLVTLNGNLDRINLLRVKQNNRSLLTRCPVTKRRFRLLGSNSHLLANFFFEGDLILAGHLCRLGTSNVSQIRETRQLLGGRHRPAATVILGLPLQRNTRVRQ